MDIETGRLTGIAGFDIGEAGSGIHLRELCKEVFQHLLVVVVIADIDLQLRDAPCIFERRIEAYRVGLLGYRLAHHMRTHAPGAQRAMIQVLLEAVAESPVIVFRAPGCAEPRGIAAQKIGLLPEYIAETGDISRRGPAAIGGAIQKAMIIRGDVSAVIMKGYVFPKQAVVVAQSMRETLRDGVEQDQVCVERARVDEDNGRGKLKGLVGVGVDDPNAGGLPF